MKLFQPKFLGCPRCNSKLDENSSSASSFWSFQEVSADVFACPKCKAKFSLLEGLKCQSKSIFGIINVYAHDSAIKQIEVTVGKIGTVNFDLIEDHSPIAEFYSQKASGVGKTIGSIFDTLGWNENELIFTSSATTNASKDQLGEPLTVNVSVYTVKGAGSPGWQRLLYESLTDLSRQRNGLAVFKLATSAEILCDRLFERYLTTKSVPKSVQETVSGRIFFWPDRVKRTQSLIETVIDTNTSKLFGKAAESFKYVRNQRNKFAHDDPNPIKTEQAELSFRKSIDLFWYLDKLRAAIG